MAFRISLKYMKKFIPIILFLFTLTASAHTMTANGGAVTETGTVKIGTAAGQFTDTSVWADYLTTPDSTDWTFGTGDFTIEGWAYATAASTNGFIWAHDDYPAENDRSIYLTTYGGGTNAGLTMRVSLDGSTWANSNAPITTTINAWHHYAVVRHGTDFSVYLDGTGASQLTSSSAVHDSAASIMIGDIPAAAGLRGYIDEVRVSNIARYTANFTPSTTAFTCDANTVLLLHMDGTNGGTSFPDSSSCPPVSSATDAGEGFMIDTLP